MSIVPGYDSWASWKATYLVPARLPCEHHDGRENPAIFEGVYVNVRLDNERRKKNLVLFSTPVQTKRHCRMMQGTERSIARFRGC